MNHKNYIRTMFDNTKNGMLTLTHYPEDGSEEFDRTYPVNWDSQTAEVLEKQFDKLRCHLDHIGLLHDELQAFIQKEKRIPLSTFSAVGFVCVPFLVCRDCYNERKRRKHYARLWVYTETTVF